MSLISDIKKGNYTHEWTRITVEGLPVDVSTDALRVGGNRVGVTAAQAQEIADLLGAMLPTCAVLDARWEASCKLEPVPMDVVRATSQQHSQLVDSKLPKGIAADVGKHWVLHPSATPKRAVLYGWHVPYSHGGRWRGIPVYPPASGLTKDPVIQRPSTAHNYHHVDYSMTLVLMRPVRPGDVKRLLSNDTPVRLPIASSAKPVLSRARGGADFTKASKPRAKKGPAKRKLKPPADVVVAAADTLPPPPAATPTWRPARHYKRAQRKLGDVLWVVMHVAQTKETSVMAEALGDYAHTMTREASWHYAVDNDSVVQCVKEHDIAWAAPGANDRGIQIELAGDSFQSHAEWADPYSSAELKLAAELVRGICKRWEIPVVKVGPAEMALGRPGICGHYDVTMGIGRGRTDHVDPGPNFPWQLFLELVASG